MARAAARRGASSSSTSSSLASTSKPKQQQTEELLPAALPPLRRHIESYHRPLLLKPRPPPEIDDQQIGSGLLEWYKKVSTERGMPWRKAWIDPATEEYQGEVGKKKLRADLERRAYEVWISEIMLQQTRVATVISYWNNWTTRWPTIQDLAKASPDDVLSAWRGLGYYSRATRIHQAAQKVVDDAKMQGLLPTTAAELEKQVPGVGRYTAGAISAIVFGRAEAILDGNVARVLSRQLAFHANPKNKATTDFLWTIAQELVEAVAGFKNTDEISSEKPSFWNQALMELGSTVCTPQQPKCEECPIRNTCRAYGEGERLAISKGQLNSHTAAWPGNKVEQGGVEVDIEDLCQRCEPLGTVEGDAPAETEHEKADSDTTGVGAKRKDSPNGTAASVSAKKSKASTSTRQQSSLLSHFTKQATSSSSSKADAGKPSVPTQARIPEAALQTILDHVRLFPMKVVKAKVREEECLVCVVQIKGSHGSQWLLQQRPAKGLLASLWEFPSTTLSSAETKAAKRKSLATQFVKSIPELEDVSSNNIINKGELGSIDHVFSHLKLKMWVWRFVVTPGKEEPDLTSGAQHPRKWCTTAQVEDESMGTGMRNCWTLVQEASKWK